MIESLMNVTIVVYKLERVSDGQGGWEKAYVLDREIAGRVSQRSSSERSLAGSERAEVGYVVYTLTPLERGNVLEVDLSGLTLTLEVLAVRNPSLLGHHYESDCKEFQLETATIGIVL